jgi:hypothetical protein
MTSTPDASAALVCIIAPWSAKIVAVLRAIVETILAIAENNCSTLQESGACCRKAARRLPALRPAQSRPMMSKLGFLPPSASALHAQACQRSPECGQAVMMDLRGTSEARTKAQFAEPSAIRPWRKLMAILDQRGLDDDIGSERRTCPHVKCA